MLVFGVLYAFSLCRHYADSDFPLDYAGLRPNPSKTEIFCSLFEKFLVISFFVMEAVEEAEEEEFVEGGSISIQILDALVLDGEADMMEVEKPSPPKGPNLHPFFQSRVSSSMNLTGPKETGPAKSLPITPTQLHANAKDYLEGASDLPDSSLVLSARQEPRAGPYGKRALSKEKSSAPSKVPRGSEPKRVSVKDRLDEYPGEPFVDLEGSPFSNDSSFCLSFVPFLIDFLSQVYCIATLAQKESN
jgi:hypothetical protein